MTRSLTRISALFFSAATLVPSLHAATAGTRTSLQAVPEFLQRVFVPVLPGADNSFQITGRAIDEIVSVPSGYRVERAAGGLNITAPNGEASGYARVRLGGRELTLTLVNLVPYESMRGGKLEGYQVGEYLEKPHKGMETYRRPAGFLRLTSENAGLWVSDHYRMSDFQCKLDGPNKFLILRTEALLKLELLQHELGARHGLDFTRFTIMSGYRTPYYNARIGNETGYSRHLYGDAMDIYIDEDRSGEMDDVNRDGSIDAKDARFILKVAESIDNSPQWSWLKGGAGVYHANSAHGPYLHVDARGYVARWGAVTEEPRRATVSSRSARGR